MIWGARYQDNPTLTVHEAIVGEWTTTAAAYAEAKAQRDEAEMCRLWLELHQLLDQALELGRP